MNQKRICLVTPGHLASNPRIVKEADALHEAGFAVRVVAGDMTPGVRSLDHTILARALWPVTKIGLGARPFYLAHRLSQEFAKKVSARTSGIRWAVWAHSPMVGSLATAAAAERADLYIGHYLAGLPAAAWAARYHGSSLGFDAEDDHLGELDDTPQNRLEIDIRRKIEAHYLPQCQHLSAASPGIARAYHHRYGVTMVPILNVFPRTQAVREPAVRNAVNHGGALSVYWFSQTIGPGRGLELFINAMGKMRGRATLTIRGSDFIGYSTRLKALANKAGVAEAIQFLPSAPPDEMARLAGEHDVGLASELPTPPNHAICLSNKIFTYLLAGIPVLLSDTPAQRELKAELGEAARLVDLADLEQTAAAIDNWALDASALLAAKNKARQLSQTRFNWDIEKELLLQCVRRILQ